MDTESAHTAVAIWIRVKFVIAGKEAARGMEKNSPVSGSQEEVSPAAPQKETFAAYIQIVGPVFYNRSFSDKTKLLYGLLAAMTQAPRYYAFAKNSTLTRYLNCSERTLQRCLGDLEAAGEITIENGEGGKALRKIRLTRLQPVYPDKNDGVTPDKNDGGNKNNGRKNKKRGAAHPASREDIIQWFDLWVVKQELGEADALALITDLHDFVETRESVGKPFNTIKAAARMGNRLVALTKDAEYPLPMMRYLLNKSIINGWKDIYPLKDGNLDDYYQFLSAEYGIEPQAIDQDPQEYF